MNTAGDEKEPLVPKLSGSFCIIDSHVPTPSIDYPSDESELASMFASEPACRVYLERVRYPRGFVCCRCGQKAEPWRSGTGLLGCIDCRHATPVTADTLFHGSAIPLGRWFRALWEATDRESGLSAPAVQRIMAVRDLADANVIMRRIRAVMATAARAPMTGEVQVGITRLEVEGAGRGAKEQPFIAIGVGAEGGKSRVRLRRLGRGTSREAVRFVLDSVEHGSRVHTTSWRGFAPLVHAGYDHRVLGVSPLAAGEREVQQLLSLLKLWLWSMPNISLESLQSYLDDFTFRYNRREYPRGLLFYRLMILAVTAGGTESELAAETA